LLFPDVSSINKAVKAVWLAKKQHKIAISPARVYALVLPITVFRKIVLLFSGVSGIDKAVTAIGRARSGLGNACTVKILKNFLNNA